MNRRSFLKWAGVGLAVGAVAPSLLLAEGPACVAPAAPVVATIGEYAEYCDFSSFALASAIDEAVSNSAAELSLRAAQSLVMLNV
jgi:hypothetical protein